jgi:hypothetical protein
MIERRRVIELMVALPTYFPWQIIWIVVFSIIYICSWKHGSWKSASRTALISLIVFSAILLPFALWGGYNLNGIENGGMFVDGFHSWEKSLSLPPETTYKSATLSNYYTIGRAYLTITAEEEIIFYLLDENRPEVRYEECNSTQLGNFTGFILPYYYSEPFVVANWTMNVFNPSLNATVGVTLSIYGFEDAGAIVVYSPQRIQYEEPSRGIASLWQYTLIITLLAYFPYRKRSSFFTAEAA